MCDRLSRHPEYVECLNTFAKYFSSCFVGQYVICDRVGKHCFPDIGKTAKITKTKQNKTKKIEMIAQITFVVGTNV